MMDYLNKANGTNSSFYRKSSISEVRNSPFSSQSRPGLIVSEIPRTTL